MTFSHFFPHIMLMSFQREIFKCTIFQTWWKLSVGKQRFLRNLRHPEVSEWFQIRLEWDVNTLKKIKVLYYAEFPAVEDIGKQSFFFGFCNENLAHALRR